MNQAESTLIPTKLAYMVSKVGNCAVQITFEVFQERLVVGDAISIECLLDFLEVSIRKLGQRFYFFRWTLDVSEYAIWTVCTESKFVVKAFALLEWNWWIKMLL